MFKIIYFTGVIAGLLFPIIDDLLNRYSKIYRSSNDESNRERNKKIQVYRQGPFHYKLIVAFIPVLNLMWLIVIVLIIRMYLYWMFLTIKDKILKKFARNPHKRFIIKVVIVKLLFKSDLDHFYKLCEHAIIMRNSDAENKAIIRLLRMIEKVAAKHNKDEQQGNGKREP